jgi:Domain of unknown function (DUF4803)
MTMWRDFANSLVNMGTDYSVIKQMESVYSIVVRGSSLTQKKFINDLFKYYTRSKDSQRCEMITSPQQTFIEFFRKMYAAETKTYILAAFAYQVLNALDSSASSDTPKKYEWELKLQTEYFANRSAKFEEIMHTYAGKFTRDFWVCNAKVNQHTTFQMNKFIYGYMDYEYDLNNGCHQECHNVKHERGLRHLSSDSERRCTGMVRGCRSTLSQKFSYCFAKNEESSYMYEYMENDVFKRGAKEMCSKGINPLRNVSAYSLLIMN